MRRTTRALVIVALLAGVLPASPALAHDEEVWVVEGGGWGHGVGMSQYGAYGMALDGFTYQGIVGHYYNGAEVTDLSAFGQGINEWILSDDDPLWIGLEQDVASVTLAWETGTVLLCQAGAEACIQAPAPDGGADWVFETVAGSDPVQCQFRDVSGPVIQQVEEPAQDHQDEDQEGDQQPITQAVPEGDRPPGLQAEQGPIPTATAQVAQEPTPGPCSADVDWSGAGGDEYPLLEIEGKEYAHGLLHLRQGPDNDDFHVVLELPIREYLWGLGEVPSSWHEEALKAQATTARTYAIRGALPRGPEEGFSIYTQNDCWCHLGSTAASQVYSGWSKESEGTERYWGLRWAAAVNDTQITDAQAKVVMYEGHGLIPTYYSSSTGGATEDVSDVWGSDQSLYPYLVSRDDHWAIEPDVGNPLARWTIHVPGPELAGYLGWDDVASGEVIAGPPGAVVRFTGVDGGQQVSVELTGWETRGMLGAIGTTPEGGSPRTSPYIIAVLPPGAPFTDILDSVHQEDIAYIWELGVTKGCNPPENTLYCPGDSVTRGQMAAFLVRAFGLPAADQDFFDDDAGSVFEDDINRLAASGITTGCDERRFCPDDPVTRGQMAAFLVRAFGYSDPGEGDLFTDDDGSVFEEDIDRLGTAGVTKGCNPPDNTRFCPNDPVTRAQMASFLARALRQAEGG
ncbi:MAG: SpoIID/LytB domain-containing protein [Acidimicrobiia bacterium]